MPAPDAMRFRIGDVAVGAEAVCLTCWPKVRHETRHDAEIHLRAQVAHERDESRSTVGTLNVYGPCEHCDGFHIGHNKFQKMEDACL